MRLRDLDAAASLASAFEDEDDLEDEVVTVRARRQSGAGSVVDHIVAAIGPRDKSSKPKRKVTRKARRGKSPALVAKAQQKQQEEELERQKLALGPSASAVEASDANALSEDNKLAWNVVAAVTHHAASMAKEKARAGKPKRDNPHNWACRTCTYRNVTTNDILTKCQMCGAKSPGLLYTPDAPEYVASW